jgi:ubiquinone/menaquinone biosynthesis C-methylase UbiE
MRSGRKLSPEAKYEIAYRNKGYMEGSPGMAFISYTIHSIPFKTVLDVGCGTGYSLLSFMLHQKDAKGVEVCDYLLETTLHTFQKLGLVKKGRIQEIPYPENSFDLVYCTDVLEHIPECDVEKSIGELVRVSKRYLFLTICTMESQMLPELKLHETVKPVEWWMERVMKFRVKKVAEPFVEGEGGCKLRRNDAIALLLKKY